MAAKPKQTTVYQPTPTPWIYGLHVPYDKGFAVTHGAGPSDSKKLAGNVRMTNQVGQTMGLYVEEMEASFGLSGNEAQSRMLRQFMPRSLNQPSLMFSGRSTSSYEFNRLAAFIRESHIYALNPRAFKMAGVKNFSPLVKLEIFADDGTRIKRGSRGNFKGRHVPWSVHGYVKTINAGAQHFEVAPEFSFEFIVIGSEMKGGTGLFEDHFTGTETGRKITPWIDQFKKTNGPRSLASPGPGYVQDPTPPKKKKKHPKDPGSQGSNPFVISPSLINGDVPGPNGYN